MWPIWRGLAVTLWGAAGLLLALVVLPLGGESFGAGGVLFVVGVYGCVIVLAVVVAHTELGRRMAIERLRRGWRAQPWSLVVTLLVLVWFIVWFVFLRQGMQ